MPSIFASQKTLRSQLEELTAAQITGKVAGTAVLLTVLKNETTLFSLYNGTNSDIYVMITNPKDSDQTKMLWNILEPGQSFNQDAVSGRMLFFPAETRVYVHTDGGAAATGKVRLFVWG